MAVTSLGFNIFSTYNGAGLNRAQRALRGMNSTVGASNSGLTRNAKIARAANAAHAAMGRTVRRVNSALAIHTRATRLSSAATSRLNRVVRAAANGLNFHSRMARLASAAHRMFSAAVGRSRAGLASHSRVARAAGFAMGFLGRMVRSTGRSMLVSARSSRLAAAGHAALSRSARNAGNSHLFLSRSASAARRVISSMGGAVSRTVVHVRALGNNTRRTTSYNPLIRAMGTVLGLVGQAAGGAVSGVMQLVQSLGHMAGPVGLVVAVHLGIQALGVVAGVTSALMLSVLPIPFIAMAAFALRNSAKVKSAFNSMKSSVGSSIRKAAAPLQPFLIRGMQQVSRVAKQLQGPLRSAFAAAGPSIKGLINSVNSFVRGALPGLTAAMRNLGPKFWGPMAAGFKAIGAAIGNFFRIIGTASVPAAKIFKLFAVSLAGFISDWARLFAMMIKDGTTIGFIKGLFTALHVAMNVLQFVIKWHIVFWKIVGAVIHAVGNVIRFIIGWWRVLIFVMGVLWRATIWALVAAWRAVSAGLRAAWNAVWRGMAFVARAIWAGLRAAWRGVVFAFTIIWRAVSGALRVAWGAVWRGMSAAARAIWNGLRAAWNAVKNFFVRVARVLGTGVLFAWRALWRIAGAVGRGVWNGLRTAWNAVKNFFVRVGRILGAGVLFAWRALWRIAKAVGLGVWNFLRRAWNFVKNVFVRVARALGSGVLFVWRALWRIAKAVGLAVWGFLRRAWNFVKNVFIRVARVLGAGVLFVWRALWRIVRAVSIAVWNFLKRAWNGVKNFFIRIARILWNGIRGLFAAGSRWLRTTFWNPVRNFFTRTVPNAFKAAVKAISKAWNALKKAISKPVKAVVDVVYNNGIVKLWNAVAGAFGAPKLKSFKFKGFQEGGYTGNGPANEVAGVVHRGEYVIPKDQYKQMGQKKNLHGGQAGAKGMGPQVLQGMMDGTFSEKSNSMHGLGTRAAAGGRGGGDIAGMYKNEFNKPVRGAGGGPVDDGFDPGGFFGGIGDFFKSIGSSLVKAFSVAAGWSAKALKALGGLVLCSIAPVVNPMIQKTADMGKGVVNKAIPGAPMMQKLFSGSKKSSKKVEGNVTGQGMIQLAANAAKDWVTAHDICEGCGFQEFRPWRAGDGRREGNLDHRTRLMLAMARKNGFKGSVTQGSWSHAGASAGTHAGGGAMDTSPPSNKNVGALRSAGFAAWNRGAKWGSASFAPHTHSIAVGNHNLSPAAAQQVRDFKAGKNGLAGGGKDNFKDGSCSGKAGNCNSYRGMAAKALAANGLGGARNLSKFMTQMKKESGCNPRARNGWDSNAKAGNASVGLMQVIPTTFRANHCPGTSNNIYDPYANICASARYQKRRYGTVNGTPYRSGTRSATAGWHKVGENGPEMVRFAGGETVRTASQTRRSSGGTVTVEAKASSGGDVHVHIHGDVYAKSSMEFERMLSGAMQNLKRKGRLPK